MALLSINEKILDVASHFDFMFCPCLIDTKRKDIEAIPDKSIAVTFFNGAIRTAENEEMARLLRNKSRMLVAFGSCSYEGCIPGLSNLSSRTRHFSTIFNESPSIDNPLGIRPKTETAVAEGDLYLPSFFECVKTLDQVVEVDYSVPGCPPEPHQVWRVLESLISTNALPLKGGVIGAGISAVCDECDRTKNEKHIRKLHRIYEVVPDRKQCLLDQGIICMGIATRSGCGCRCPQVNMPCTGCYGPPEGVIDQGAKMIAALGSVLDVGGTKRLTEEEIIKRVEDIIQAIPDLAGTFYKFSLPASILRNKAG